jgi:hypothetical protein
MVRQGIDSQLATNPFRPVPGGRFARDKQALKAAVVALTFCLEPELDQAADGFGMAWSVGLFVSPSMDLRAELFWKPQRRGGHLSRRRAPSLFLSYYN